jgi:hypothetical protein
MNIIFPLFHVWEHRRNKSFTFSPSVFRIKPRPPCPQASGLPEQPSCLKFSFCDQLSNMIETYNLVLFLIFLWSCLWKKFHVFLGHIHTPRMFFPQRKG